jgi:hypothetical protein
MLASSADGQTSIHIPGHFYLHRLAFVKGLQWFGNWRARSTCGARFLRKQRSLAKSTQLTERPAGDRLRVGKMVFRRPYLNVQNLHLFYF